MSCECTFSIIFPEKEQKHEQNLLIHLYLFVICVSLNNSVIKKTFYIFDAAKMQVTYAQYCARMHPV